MSFWGNMKTAAKLQTKRFPKPEFQRVNGKK